MSSAEPSTSHDSARVEVERIVHIAEFQRLAEERMPEWVRWVVQCAHPGWGQALRENERAWQRWALRQRVLVDVSLCDTSTTVLGEPIALPVLVSPFTCSALCCPEGEVATAVATAKAGTMMALSMGATRSPEEVGAAAGRFWQQLNFAHDRGLMREVVHRAAAAGARAICLTVDLPVHAWWMLAYEPVTDAFERGLGKHTTFVRRDDTRTTWNPVAMREESRFSLERNRTWADLEWIRDFSPLPLVLKGVQTVEDARLACENGADAILVSNHGGHALDQVLGTADVLPEVVDAVQGRIEVLVDGGIRSGADVLRALALGARAVMIGRPALWGLTLGGAEGVARVLSLLGREFEVLMSMTGARNVAEVDRTRIVLRP